MKKPDLKKVARNVRTTVSKHSPEILTGLGIASGISCTILAVRATPKALRLIDERKQEEGVDKLEPKVMVQTVWKCYIPATASGAFAIACLIGASSVNAKRNAALATAYKLSESAFSEYRDKVVETFGEKKEKTVKDEIAKDRVKENPVGTNEVIITGKGNTLCFDMFSKRYFRSDIDKIKRAENEMNKKMLNNEYISLNEFYQELGLSPMPIGWQLGWRIDKGFIDLYFSSQLDEDGNPCLTIDFNNQPEYGFSSLM
jgi:hypothetical protein